MVASAEMRLRDTAITADYLCTEVGVSVISGKPPYTFQWIPEDNLADPTAQTTAAFISESSVYHVVATDGFGCGVDTATVTVTITNPPLGIGEVEDSPVKVYPNPVDGELTNVYWINVEEALSEFKAVYEPYISASATAIQELTLKDLQPSQFYISEKKLHDIEVWLDPADLSGFEPIPVKILDGVPVMTDSKNELREMTIIERKGAKNNSVWVIH